MDRLPIDWLLLGIDWLLLSIARMTELAHLLVLTKLVYRRVLLHLRIHRLPVRLYLRDLVPL